MPELAEVEYFRRRWDAGVGQRITRVNLNGKKRVFRGGDITALEVTLSGAKLLGSEARGKQMLFRFSRDAWLGVHLGMTGELRSEPPDYRPGRHDHLVLFQKKQALVFEDARMFGRVLFFRGKCLPPWWEKLPPPLTSPEFTLARLRGILQRRGRAPLKAVLLMQEFFPGIGNWMADEILWQAKLHPSRAAGGLAPAEERTLWQKTRAICRTALKTIGVDWSDPPDDWLIHQRWKKAGHCPRHGTALQTATIGGRTTAWCPRCQPRS